MTDVSFEENGANGKYFGSISQDFVKVADALKEASYQIRKNNFSYPIFPVSKTLLPIGQLLYGAAEQNLDWNYHASYLDDFVARGLIDLAKREDFISIYKAPDEFCCLFVVSKSFTQFVFIPYPEDSW